MQIFSDIQSGVLLCNMMKTQPVGNCRRRCRLRLRFMQTMCISQFAAAPFGKSNLTIGISFTIKAQFPHKGAIQKHKKNAHTHPLHQETESEAEERNRGRNSNGNEITNSS